MRSGADEDCRLPDTSSVSPLSSPVGAFVLEGDVVFPAGEFLREPPSLGSTPLERGVDDLCRSAEIEHSSAWRIEI